MNKITVVAGPILLLSSLLLAVGSASDAQAEEHRSRAVLRAFQWEHPCPSTGLRTGACPGYIKDHVIALCDGGPDAVSNLQWQTVEDAKIKDRTECHHRPAGVTQPW